MFNIEIITNKSFVSGKLETIESFVVVDQAGEPVLAKAFKSREEAEGEISKLGNYALGLEFVKASYPDMASKAQKAKAGVVAEYLDWLAAGKEAGPVAEEAAPGVEEVEAAPVANEEEEEF